VLDCSVVENASQGVAIFLFLTDRYERPAIATAVLSRCTLVVRRRAKSCPAAWSSGVGGLFLIAQRRSPCRRGGFRDCRSARAFFALQTYPVVGRGLIWTRHYGLVETFTRFALQGGAARRPGVAPTQHLGITVAPNRMSAIRSILP